MSLVPKDQAQRTRAIEELETSLLVEAGAGTGKTTLLVERLVRLLCHKTEIGRLAAITFTEKAAAELKLRLRDRLEAEAAAIRESGEAGNLELATRYESAVAGLDRAAVTTIHGFCASLLRERPVEASVDPGFEVADAERQEVLFEEAFSEFLAELFGEESEALKISFAAGLGLHSLKQLCRDLIEQRDLLTDPEFVIEPLSRPDPELLCGSFRDLVELLESIRGECKHPEEDRLIPLIDELSALGRSLVREPLLQQERILLAYEPKSPQGAQKNWIHKETLAEAKQRIKDFKSLHEARSAAECSKRANELLLELRRLPGFYERVKRRHGVLDFQDLLIKTRDLLRQETEVRRDFQRRFDTILLDEFQDTDPLQAEIAFFLAEDPDSGPAENWRDVHVGPGRLFLVGDPKQSIYRFRRADIEVYEQARELILRSGGARLKIQVNFRSSPALLEWINRRFERLIQPSPDGGAFQPEYVGIEAAPGACDLGAGVLLLSDSDQEGLYPRADEARMAEARFVAAFLTWATGEQGALQVRERKGGEKVVRTASFRDCALLFRTRTSLAIYEEALRSRAIPYRISGGRHFYRRAEVKALVALLRVLDDPSDDIAQVALLRSPLFGISDDDLAAFRIAGGRFDSLAGDPEATPRALGLARELLRELHDLRHSLGVAAFVQEVLERTRALELFLLKPMGEQRVANLRRFIELARRLEAAGRCTFRSFVRQLREGEQGGLAEEESALVAGLDDAVQLMTIHKAKGLEFPIVVLCDLGGEGRGGERLVCQRGPPPRVEFQLARKALRTPGFLELCERERRLEDAERRRLLYVACTRAGCHLVLPRFPFGKPTKGADPKSLFAYLSDDERFAGAESTNAADSSEAAWMIPKRELDLKPREEQPLRFELDAGPGDPVEIKELLGDREQFRRSLTERFVGEHHRKNVSSASAVKAGLSPPQGEQDSGGRKVGDGLRGPAFGTLVHQLLEQIDYSGNNPALAELSELLASRLDLDQQAAEAGVTLVRRFLESKLSRRIQAARRRLREVPFAARFDDVLWEGTLDLLLEESSGELVIIDFKTDDVEGPALQERAASYAGQGRLYARAVEEATGRAVDEVLLAFLRGDQVIRLDRAE